MNSMFITIGINHTKGMSDVQIMEQIVQNAYRRKDLETPLALSALNVSGRRC